MTSMIPQPPAPEITLIGTPLFAAKNGSVKGLVLKSMEPPARAACVSPGLAKKIVSTSNPAFSKQPLSFPTNRGAISSATKCPALTLVKAIAVVDGPKAAITIKQMPDRHPSALATRRFSTFKDIRDLPSKVDQSPQLGSAIRSSYCCGYAPPCPARLTATSVDRFIANRDVTGDGPSGRRSGSRKLSPSGS